MDVAFSFTNFIILFGALQGYVLCISLFYKRHLNPSSVKMFILFIFSLSFLNMMYAFLDLNIFKYYRPLHMFPFPYKWLIAVAFYFYVKNLFLAKGEKPYHIREWWLVLPAIFYGILRTYWFSIAVKENSYRITKVIVDSNFFRIQECVYLLFNVLLGIILIKFINQKNVDLTNKVKSTNATRWLKKFVVVFIIINAIHLVIFILDLSLHQGQESFLFLYPNLIINVLFIYWIGLIGFSNPKRLFYNFNTGKKRSPHSDVIMAKLEHEMEIEKKYRNPKLTINDLAYTMDINPKDLSSYINEVHQCNFSEFLNTFRINHVLYLLSTKEADKYTLLTLAEEAGFNSKSNFNATFKRIVGKTPSAYKKQLEQK